MSALDGRTALVTGAGRGIGRAIAGDATVVPADLGDATELARVAERAEGADVLINNAAVVWPLGPTATVAASEWAAAAAINVAAVASYAEGALITPGVRGGAAGPAPRGRHR